MSAYKFITLSIILSLFYSCSKEKNETNEKEEIIYKLDFEYKIDSEKKEINLINKSVGYKNFVWNFGDNTTSNENSPSHTYKLGGKYKISLKGEATFNSRIGIEKKEKNISIGNISDALANSTIHIIKDIDFAGFNIVIKSHNTSDYIITNRFLEISNDEEFTDLYRSEEVVDTYQVNNLIPDKIYWLRIKTISRNTKTDEEIQTYSTATYAKTLKLPLPYMHMKKDPMLNQIDRFSVFIIKIKSEHITDSSFKYEVKAYRKYDRSEANCFIDLIAPTIFDYKRYYRYSCYMEAKSAFIFECTIKYKGKSSKRSLETETSSYLTCVQFQNPTLFDRNNPDIYSVVDSKVKKIVSNNTTEFEIGLGRNYVKLHYIIHDFKPIVGSKYKFSYNTNKEKDDKISIDLENDTYAYLSVINSSEKFYLSNDNIFLELYRESDEYYYFRTTYSESTAGAIFRYPDKTYNDYHFLFTSVTFVIKK